MSNEEENSETTEIENQKKEIKAYIEIGPNLKDLLRHLGLYSTNEKIKTMCDFFVKSLYVTGLGKGEKNIDIEIVDDRDS